VVFHKGQGYIRDYAESQGLANERERRGQQGSKIKTMDLDGARQQVSIGSMQYTGHPRRS
jgi:hypothetical protein